MISLALVSLLCVSPQSVNSVTLSDGDVLKFDSIAVTDNQLKITTNELTRSVNTEQVHRIEFAKTKVLDAGLNVRTQLTNGSILFSRSFRLEGDLVRLIVGPVPSQNSKLITIGVARSLVGSIKLDKSISDLNWKKVLAIEIESDGLIIERDGELDILAGIIKSISHDAVQFDFQGRVNDIKLSRLAGVSFFRPKRKFDTLLAVRDIHGNTIFGSKLKIDDSRLELTVDENEFVTMPNAILANIDFSAGRYVDLGQLSPIAVEWKPFFRSNLEDELVEELLKLTLSTRKCWTANVSFGAPLSLKSREVVSRSNPTGRINFNRGVSVMGGSNLIFSIPEDAQQFSALTGIQHNANPAGAVFLQIKVDGKILFEKAISARDETPTPISFDLPVAVEGVDRRITIGVGYGAGRQVGDVLSICNARFSK